VEQELEQQRIPIAKLDLVVGRNYGAAYQSSVTNKLTSQPEERLLEIVVGFGGDIVVLKVLLAMECNGFGLDLSLLDVDLVTSQDNWNVLADTDQIT